MSNAAPETQPAREHGHRVANILQFLSALARLRGQRVDEEAARRELAWMSGAIAAIGALERRRSPQGVDFGSYLSDMAPVWAQRHGIEGAKVRVEAEPVRVSDQAASSLCLIVQELVNNALVHGMADGRGGQVSIGLSTRPDARCVICVEDDGDGFDPASPAAKERFGLWLARTLTAQVRGAFTLTTGPGVRAELAFPLES